MSANNWCCEIVNKTFKLFREKKLYENSIERMVIFHYWEEIGFDKQFCEKCQRLTKKEEIKLETDSKKESKELDREMRKCDNCGKIKLSKKEHELEKYRWCSEHGKVDRCVILSSNFCSLKCLKAAEEEIKQHWLKKLTISDLNQEIWRREKLHKRIFASCMDCRKKTNQWDEEEIENATCPDCSTSLIEQNKKWDEEDKKKKIECYKCGKTKLLGYRKNYYKIYCIDCAKEYKEWRSKHFWFCADDCPQEN